MSEFKDYRKEKAEFEKNFPMKEAVLEKGAFPYIMAGPDNAEHTLVFLNGGMDSYQMWLRYVEELSDTFRVLSFNYPMIYGTNQELCNGMHELFGKLNTGKVILIGASMGGIIAQIYAKKYPGDVEGMCLMSTAGLTQAALKKYGKLLGLLTPAIGIMKILPYSWTVKGEKKQCAKYVNEAKPEQRAYFADMFDDIYETYTKEKDIHVEVLMRDFRNQQLCSRSDFEYLAGKVLLLLPEDDSEFPQELQQELVKCMTDPVVIPHITGGHLSTMRSCDQYIGYIRDFIREKF